MNSHEQRIAQAWLEAPDSGIIELSRDWADATLPPLSLGPGGPEFVQLARVPDHTFGCESGFFVNAFREIFFFIQLAHQPEIDPETTAVYLAGDFNGWQNAVGNPDWRLLPASLDGERVLLFAAHADRFLTQPPQRFKFVTGEHRWLPVPSQAVNAARDDLGNYNYVIDPARTGRHLFHFKTAAPVDLTEALAVRWTDDAGAEPVPLRPGNFFFQFKSHVPLGAVVGEDETTFRLFAPRARAVWLHLADNLKRPEAAASYAMDRRSDGAWEARLDGNLDGWYYWYTLDGPRNCFGLFDSGRRILDPYALAAVGRDGPGIVIDRRKLAPADRGFRTPAWQDLVIAEAHVRDLAALAPIKLKAEERTGFTGLKNWIESPDFHLARLGVNAVELQPVQEFDGVYTQPREVEIRALNPFSQPGEAGALLRLELERRQRHQVAHMRLGNHEILPGRRAESAIRGRQLPPVNHDTRPLAPHGRQRIGIENAPAAVEPAKAIARTIEGVPVVPAIQVAIEPRLPRAVAAPIHRIAGRRLEPF